MNDEIDEILQEQARYYEARAAEYDDVWFRRGPYDMGPEQNARWFEEVEKLESAIDGFDATGDVLELACGTGLMTRRLAPRASSLIAMDSSNATLEINRARVADPKVEYIEADLYAWEPPEGRRFDEIVFTFLLSHVPPQRFEEFWARIGRWLRPGGRVFFCDDRYESEPRPSNPGFQSEGGPSFAHRRTLHDGREFTIVKIFYTPEGIEAELAPLGWQVDAAVTGAEFVYGVATPRFDAAAEESSISD
jgi:SAM-dependent methyltransferase